MQPMWICICSSKQFEETSENSLRRKAISVTLQLFIQALLHVIWKLNVEKKYEKRIKNQYLHELRKMICKTNSIFNIILHSSYRVGKNQGPSAFSVVARKFPGFLEKSRRVPIFTLDRRESVFSEVIPCNDRLLIKIGNNIVALVGPLSSKTI